MYINIHSHGGPTEGAWVMQNRYDGFTMLTASGWYTAGLHPWYITAATWQQQLAELKATASRPNVLAVGECGLDKVCTTDFTLQQTVFSAQIQLAASIKKPLLLHCVKAYDEVLRQLQEQQFKGPVIFHGFNKSVALALQLVNKGYYLSFGQALQQPRLQEVLAALPPEKIFLETDAAEVSIQTIYNLAAAALQIDINALSLQLQKNTAGVFGISF